MPEVERSGQTASVARLSGELKERDRKDHKNMEDFKMAALSTKRVDSIFTSRVGEQKQEA